MEQWLSFSAIFFLLGTASVVIRRFATQSANRLKRVSSSLNESSEYHKLRDDPDVNDCTEC
jgi:hypothetical protein